MVARLTTDQKAACSNHVGVNIIFTFYFFKIVHFCFHKSWSKTSSFPSEKSVVVPEVGSVLTQRLQLATAFSKVFPRSSESSADERMCTCFCDHSSSLFLSSLPLSCLWCCYWLQLFYQWADHHVAVQNGDGQGLEASGGHRRLPAWWQIRAWNCDFGEWTNFPHRRQNQVMHIT